GRGGVLRPEGRLPDERRAGPGVADQHDPGGLHPAVAVGLQIYRRGGQGADAGGAAPRRDGDDGAVPGRADRAVRRKLPVLAGSAAGGPHSHRRPPSRLCRRGPGEAGRGRFPRRSGRPQREDGQAHPRGGGAESAGHAGDGRPGRGERHGERPQARRGRSRRENAGGDARLSARTTDRLILRNRRNCIMSEPLFHSRLADYLDSLVPPRDEVMQEMEAYAKEVGFPIIGAAAGYFNYLIARLMGATRVFELGSGYGYSTAWFARAVRENGGGVVHHVVWNEELSQKARGYLWRLGYGGIVQFHIGEAVETLRNTAGPFDLMFTDIDKQGYPASIPVIKEK